MHAGSQREFFFFVWGREIVRGSLTAPALVRSTVVHGTGTIACGTGIVVHGTGSQHLVCVSRSWHRHGPRHGPVPFEEAVLAGILTQKFDYILSELLVPTPSFPSLYWYQCCANPEFPEFGPFLKKKKIFWTSRNVLGMIAIAKLHV